VASLSVDRGHEDGDGRHGSRDASVAEVLVGQGAAVDAGDLVIVLHD
jgi:hypothetical protein